MKQSNTLKQTLQTKLYLSQEIRQSLQYLQMNQNELMDCIHHLTATNPVIEYIPSVDMHQFLHDTAVQPTTLKDDLYYQLHTCNFAYDHTIATFLIESLDAHGLLSYTPVQYADMLHTDIETIRYHLQILQSFEPSGIAAQNSFDSICIQLQKKNQDLALQLLTTCSQALLQQDYSKIIEDHHLNIDEINICLNQIRQCHPYPFNGDNFSSSIQLPDFEIIVEDDTIQILPYKCGHFQIADELSLMEDQLDTLRTYFEEAYFFIDCINHRNQTLLLLVNQLIHVQRNYFLFHDELQAYTMQELADHCKLHVSTVSRALSGKTYLFAKELYPVRDLFISSTKEGSSKDSVCKAISLLVNQEDKNNPLSDQQIQKGLAEMELYVSRRTIAKYRNQLHIPNIRKRKR